MCDVNESIESIIDTALYIYGELYDYSDQCPYDFVQGFLAARGHVIPYSEVEDKASEVWNELYA